MFRPLKRLEAAWNARTPVYLHNGTKENFIWQLKLLGVVLLGLFAKDKWNDYQLKRKLKNRPSPIN